MNDGPNRFPSAKSPPRGWSLAKTAPSYRCRDPNRPSEETAHSCAVDRPSAQPGRAVRIVSPTSLSSLSHLAAVAKRWPSTETISDSRRPLAPPSLFEPSGGDRPRPLATFASPIRFPFGRYHLGWPLCLGSCARDNRPLTTAADGTAIRRATAGYFIPARRCSFLGLVRPRVLRPIALAKAVPSSSASKPGT
jgi:hypothetical protein